MNLKISTFYQKDKKREFLLNFMKITSLTGLKKLNDKLLRLSHKEFTLR
jgi:hypothetical protein